MLEFLVLLIQPDIPGTAAITESADSLTLRVATLSGPGIPLGRSAVLVANAVDPTGIRGESAFESPVAILPANGQKQRERIVFHCQSLRGKVHVKD